MSFNNNQWYDFTTTNWNEVPAVYGVFDSNMRILYIGQTDNLYRRMNEHRYNREHLMYRYNPTFVLVEIIQEERSRFTRERELINLYDPPCNQC